MSFQTCVDFVSFYTGLVAGKLMVYFLPVLRRQWHCLTLNQSVPSCVMIADTSVKIVLLISSLHLPSQICPFLQICRGWGRMSRRLPIVWQSSTFVVTISLVDICDQTRFNVDQRKHNKAMQPLWSASYRSIQRGPLWSLRMSSWQCLLWTCVTFETLRLMCFLSCRPIV